MSQQTIDTHEELSNVFGLPLRASDTPRVHRAAMLLDVSEDTNLKTLVLLWRMYGGVVKRAVGKKVPKPLMWDRLVEANYPSLATGFYRARSIHLMDRG